MASDRPHHARQHARGAEPGSHPHRPRKGLPAWQLLFATRLPNAAVPIVTIIGVGVALLLGGVVVTESVFAIPGVGRLVVDAILHRDYPVIQGVLLIFSGYLRDGEPDHRSALRRDRSPHPVLSRA